MYNTTFMNNTGNIVELVAGINNASNSFLSIMLLIVIWVVVFIAMKHFDTKVVFLSASVTTTLVGLFFLILGWISFTIFIFPLIMMMFSLIGFIFAKD